MQRIIQQNIQGNDKSVDVSYRIAQSVDTNKGPFEKHKLRFCLRGFLQYIKVQQGILRGKKEGESVLNSHCNNNDRENKTFKKIMGQ